MIGAAHLPLAKAGAPDQGVTVGTADQAVTALVSGLKKHRFANRDIEAVAA